MTEEYLFISVGIILALWVFHQKAYLIGIFTTKVILVYGYGIKESLP
jgi:hypothetical protein